MFIVNIEDLYNKYDFYICDEDMSNKLVINGFCLLGIYNDKYYFTKSDDLFNFLDLENLERQVE